MKCIRQLQLDVLVVDELEAAEDEARKVLVDADADAEIMVGQKAIEEALRKSNAKFERRFRYIENRLREQEQDIRDVTIQKMEELYQEGKRLEHQPADEAR